MNDSTVADDFDRIDKALKGQASAEQMRIARVGVQWVATLLKKNGDYGSAIFSSPTFAPDMPCDAAIRVRMSDKVQRLKTLFARNGEPEVAESIEDTVQDLGAYCLLWLVSREVQP